MYLSRLKNIFCACCILFLGMSLFAQTKVKFKDKYVHTATGKVFPEKLFNTFEVEEVVEFDARKEDVGIKYENPESGTSLTIYIYPSDKSFDGRLRDEYFTVLQAIDIASEKQIDYAFEHEIIEDTDILVNGLKATFINKKKKSKVAVYECGTWFLKVRITEGKHETRDLSVIEKAVVRFYSPTSLVRSNPLEPEPKIAVSDGAFRDSLLLASTLYAAMTKVKWAEENTSLKERMSGFPDLYMAMHIETLKAFAELEKKDATVPKRGALSGVLIDELNTLIADGFLEEYLMDNYKRILIVPDDVQLDEPGYQSWKKAHHVPNFSMLCLYHVGYEPSKK